MDLLFSLGYERQELVRERGEVAIRGEVVDLFPPHLLFRFALIGGEIR